jgi:hypothetical protein
MQQVWVAGGKKKANKGVTTRERGKEQNQNRNMGAISESKTNNAVNCNATRQRGVDEGDDGRGERAGRVLHMQLVQGTGDGC